MLGKWQPNLEKKWTIWNKTWHLCLESICRGNVYEMILGWIKRFYFFKQGNPELDRVVYDLSVKWLTKPLALFLQHIIPATNLYFVTACYSCCAHWSTLQWLLNVINVFPGNSAAFKTTMANYHTVFATTHRSKRILCIKLNIGIFLSSNSFWIIWQRMYYYINVESSKWEMCTFCLFMRYFWILVSENTIIYVDFLDYIFSYCY